MMHLNTLQPAKGSKKTKHRLGRGIGSGLGKTSGKGHKGQKARSGGYHKVGFEGGQMPLQRRLPKFGFYSKQAKTKCEVRLNTLAELPVDTIDMEVLRTFNIINHNIKMVKIINTGKLEKSIHVKGLPCTANAKQTIESLGGSVSEG